jgi:hypothetical protein
MYQRDSLGLFKKPLQAFVNQCAVKSTLVFIQAATVSTKKPLWYKEMPRTERNVSVKLYANTHLKWVGEKGYPLYAAVYYGSKSIKFKVKLPNQDDIFVSEDLSELEKGKLAAKIASYKKVLLKVIDFENQMSDNNLSFNGFSDRLVMYQDNIYNHFVLRSSLEQAHYFFMPYPNDPFQAKFGEAQELGILTKSLLEASKKMYPPSLTSLHQVSLMDFILALEFCKKTTGFEWFFEHGRKKMLEYIIIEREKIGMDKIMNKKDLYPIIHFIDTSLLDP